MLCAYPVFGSRCFNPLSQLSHPCTLCPRCCHAPPPPFILPGAQLPREPTKDGVISALVSKGVSLNDLTRGKCDIAITNPDMSSGTRQLLISVHTAVSAECRDIVLLPVELH
jgi:hypothetical protein